MRALVKNSTGKAIHCRGSGHSVNRRTPKIEIFCAHPLPKSPVLIQRTFATKILPNFWVNFLVRFASKPLFFLGSAPNCSDSSLVLFAGFFGFGVLLALEIFQQHNMLYLPRFGHFPARSRKESGCWEIGPAFGNAPGFSPLRPLQPS